MLDLKHLRAIQALRNGGSLAEAAERLYMTESALSHQLKALETRLAQSVFIRKSRPLRFTHAGEKLLLLADAVLPLIERCERELSQLAEGKRGRLHMAIECHSCFQWLMPALEKYRQQWPDVELDFASGFNFEPLPALQLGELDLVITADPIKMTGIHYHPLFRYENLLAMQQNHPLARVAAIQPEQLRDQTLLCYPVDSQRLAVFRDFMTPAGIAPAAVRSVELTLMMIQLVLSGRGVASLPNWVLAEYQQQTDLVTKPLGTGVWSTLYLAFDEKLANRSYLQHFITLARNHCLEHLKGIEALS